MLPRMNFGDWLFWSIMTWIGFNLVWLRFVEDFAPQWVGAVLATIIALAVFKFGPRPKEDEEDDQPWPE